MTNCSCPQIRRNLNTTLECGCSGSGASGRSGTSVVRIYCSSSSSASSLSGSSFGAPGSASPRSSMLSFSSGSSSSSLRSADLDDLDALTGWTWEDAQRQSRTVAICTVGRMWTKGKANGFYQPKTTAKRRMYRLQNHCPWPPNFFLGSADRRNPNALPACHTVL